MHSGLSADRGASAQRRLLNRSQLLKYIDQFWFSGNQNQSTCSLLLTSINHFDNYLHAFGEQAGADAFTAIGAALFQVIKREEDRLGQYGEDCLAVFLPETAQGGARQIAARICQAVEQLKIFHGYRWKNPFLGVTIGAASGQSHPAIPVRYLIRTAEQALLKARLEGQTVIQEIESSFQNSAADLS